MKKIIATILSIIIALFPGVIAGENSRRFVSIPYGELSNANASENAKAVYSYICSTYKHKILTGQQESTWVGGPDYEMDYIEETTGKLPAIRGLDYHNDDFAGVTRRAKDWWSRGGIVTISWHCGSDFTGHFGDSLHTELDWDAALTKGTPEYEALIAGMDRAAVALKELDEAGVPVLWRPFHELDGNWFWWSRGGPRNFVKLWRIMYTRYTDYWALDNLIWVCGYQAKTRTPELWYPGDGYVDIAGADSYFGDGTQALLFSRIKVFIMNRKPICFHENGAIPDMDELQRWSVDWCYFMTWHTEYLVEDKWNTKEHLNDVYNSEYAITLDELPAFIG